MSSFDASNFVEDFTEVSDDVPPRPFKIDDDVFYVTSVPPAGALMDLAEMASFDQNNPTHMVRLVGKMSSFLDAVMMPESAVRFAERMRSPIKPIKATQIVKILQWLMKVYSGGKDQSAQSLHSQAGPGATGPNSTDGAQPVASTPGNYR